MLVWETVKVGWRIFSRDAPFRLIVTSFWVRSVGECLLFTAIGLVAAGPAGADHAFTGAVVLTMVFYTLAMATDIPLRDRWDGTYPRLATGRMFPFLAFLLRSVPQLMHALLAATVALLVVGFATGRAETVLATVPAIPLLLVGAVSAVGAGLCVVAPAIGTRLDVITYNVMTALIIVCSGAVIPRGSSQVLDAVGTVLPLTHTVSAVRAVQEGGPFWHHVGAEALVAGGWILVAAMLVNALERRGRRLGRGVFA